MKKVIVALAFLLFTLTCCDKYHRNKYTGTWEFTVDRIFYNEINYIESVIVVELRDTVYYVGKILTDEDLENGLLIKYTEKDEVYAWIEEINDEVFLYTILGTYGGKYASGQFEGKNKLCLELYWGRTVYSLIEGPYRFRRDDIIGAKKLKN